MTPAIAECTQCGGFGSIGDGPFSMGTTCPECNGTGIKEAEKAI